jgi:hypothetical protein
MARFALFIWLNQVKKLMGGFMELTIAIFGLICMTALIITTTSDMKAVKVRVNRRK